MSVVPSRMQRVATPSLPPAEPASLRAPFALRAPTSTSLRSTVEKPRDTRSNGAPTSAPTSISYTPETRLRLWELPTHFLCSIVGTCLSTGELRRILTKALARDLTAFTDVELHSEAVSLSATGGAGGRAIQKALDLRHATAVKRLGRQASVAELRAAWDEALATGDIPGSYWVVMTHRASDDALTRRAFGDIHMLSHLVSSANRADLRRLRSLEDEHAELILKLERQQSHLQEAFRARDAAWASLSALVVERANPDESMAEHAQLAALRELVQRQSRQIARLERRSDQADARAVEQARQVTMLEGALADRDGDCEALRAELASVESMLAERTSIAGAAASLHGVSVLYVGGIARAIPTIRDLVQERDGVFLHHDGGLEERPGALAGLVSRCDVALFPVDRISHEAALGIKRLCQQFGRPFVPLRSAGLSSAVAAIDAFAIPRECVTPTHDAARDAMPAPGTRDTA